jgi:para-nitrobenzyl esterase
VAQNPPEAISAKPVRFICDRSQAVSVTFNTNGALLVTEQGEFDLMQSPVASGISYSGMGHSIRGKEHELTWSTPDGMLFNCRDQEWAMRQPQIQPTKPVLTGSLWTLVAFQSSDDAIGKMTPANPERYTLSFDSGGRLAMQLDCNRGMGSWQVTGASDSGGALAIKGGAMTRAACRPGSMDVQIVRDLSRVRSFIIKGDRLFLALEADSGIYEFKRG